MEKTSSPIITSENLKEIVQKVSNKVEVKEIADWVGNDIKRFEMLWHIKRSLKPAKAAKVSWVIEACCSRYSKFLKASFLNEIVNTLPKTKHQGLRRNYTKILMKAKIPESSHGVLIDILSEWILDPSTTVAVKCNGLSLLAELAKVYPALSNEIKAMIEFEWERNTAAFRARSKRILNQLEKG